MLRLVHVCLCLALFIQADNLRANDGETSKNELKKPPVITEKLTVTAERRPVPVSDTPAFVTVLDDQTLGEQLVSDIRDAVRYIPGVTVERDLTRLGLNGFTIRGIGGNRVMSQVDGVRTAEQFSFGPLSAHQFSVDVETLKGLEIIRGAASSLYGSDALGGVVSFITKDPSDYLNNWGRENGFQLKSGFNTESDATQLAFTGAARRGRFEFSITASARDFGPRENQGAVDTEDSSRTLPNDIDGESLQLLGKVVWNVSESNQWRLTLENQSIDSETKVFSSQGLITGFGPPTLISNSLADDTQDRFRLSLDQVWLPEDAGFADRIKWQVYIQTSNAEQTTTEERAGTGNPILRTGQFDYGQDETGLSFQAEKAWNMTNSSVEIIYGFERSDSEFEQIRNRHDLDLITGNPDAYTGSLTFPTRYFPNSTVTESGLFLQAKTGLLGDKLNIIGGLRYDDYDLDADQNDRIFLDSTATDTPPADSSSDSVSPKLGFVAEVQPWLQVTGNYAEGFRAPVYSAVNSGFTNLAGGYQTLPNPDLRPEESENLEFGLRFRGTRASFDITYFDNNYSDFIESTNFVGVSQTGILLFQAQNLGQVQIDGFEMRGDWQIDDHWQMRVSYGQSEGEDQATGQPLNAIVPNQGMVGFAYRTAKWGGEISGLFVDSKDREDINFDGNPFAPSAYELLDLTVYYRFARGFSINAGGFNLTDETYYAWPDVRGRSADDATIARYSAPGRQFRFDLRYQF